MEKNKKTAIMWHKSLKFRLMLIWAIVSFVIGIASMFFLYRIYQNRIEVEYSKRAVALSGIVAHTLSGEIIDFYLETLEKDDEYDNILDRLRIMQRQFDVTYIVVTVFVNGGDIYIFDTDEDEEGQMSLGEFYFFEENSYSEDVLRRLRTGERTDPYIHDTVWGRLLTVSEPIYRKDGSTAGYASVSILMDTVLRERRIMITALGFVILLVFIFSVIANLYIIQKLVIFPVKTLVNDVTEYHPGVTLSEKIVKTVLEPKLTTGSEFALLEHSIIKMQTRIESTMKKLIQAEELTKLMLDATPLACHLWDRSLKMIDCNEAALKLYGFKSKDEYIKKYVETCRPEFQRDGRSSSEMAQVMINRAFEEGSCKLDWMNKLPNGRPIPTEVILVRVKYKDDFVVAAYTRDLRDIASMERQISWLKAEAEQAYIDGLTNIHNRRYFDENLTRLIKTLSRSGGELSLMMMDIDHFKFYNDTYGHSEGDNCLRKIAQTLSASVTRKDDFIARYGGEEFAVVLPNTNEEGAKKIAEKLLESVRGCNIPHEKNAAAPYVTVSIGVTTGKAEHTQSNEAYIKKADEQLYISKQNGRNKYTFALL